jgi:RNA polymerase sigma-70 factor, ECF subfamily
VDVHEVARTEGAFASFVDRWYGSSLRLARMLARDEQTARRATLDAWLAVVAHLSELDGEAPLHVPVLRATIESLAARVTADDPPAAYDSESFEAEGHRWAGWWRDDATPTDWERSPADEAIVRALADLDPAAGAVVLLRDVACLPAADVEQVLDLTPADQRTLLHAGRAAIWEALA